MRIEPFDLLDLVHGALHTALTEEGELRFARFTEEQKEGYGLRKPDHGFSVKCTGTPGVMLDFVSDTDRLSFEAEFSKTTSHDFAVMDLWVDNVLLSSFRAEEYGKHTVSFSLPQGQHRITLYLPWSTSTVLRNVEIDDGASLIPVERSLRILALGDSITQGSVAEHPSLTYVSCMARELNAEVLNQGIGGYCFYKESLQGAPDWMPDLVTLAYGTNDFSILNTKAEFEAQVRDYMQALTAAYPDTPILAITPIRRFDLPINELVCGKDYTFTDAMAILHRVFAEYPQISILDGLSFFPHHPDFLLPDKLHPNDLGFALYGRAVAEKIKSLLG